MEWYYFVNKTEIIGKYLFFTFMVLFVIFSSFYFYFTDLISILFIWVFVILLEVFMSIYHVLLSPVMRKITKTESETNLEHFILLLLAGLTTIPFLHLIFGFNLFFLLIITTLYCLYSIPIIYFIVILENKLLGKNILIIDISSPIIAVFVVLFILLISASLIILIVLYILMGILLYFFRIW